MIIYVVTNIVNSKQYVGQTVNSLKVRQKNHKCEVKTGSEYAFHRALRKYGFDSFTWDIVETCSSKEELDLKEIEYISKLNPQYNMTLGGGGTIGYNHSQATKDKISKSNLGKTAGNTHRKGKTISQESKDKIALVRGKPFKVFLEEREIGNWINQSQCARDLSLNQAHISSCLLGIKKQHKGYRFEYA